MNGDSTLHPIWPASGRHSPSGGRHGLPDAPRRPQDQPVQCIYVYIAGENETGEQGRSQGIFVGESHISKVDTMDFGRVKVHTEP